MNTPREQPRAPRQAPPAAPLATSLGLLWPLLWVLLATLVLVVAVGAGLRWLLYTESGARWAVRQAPGLELQNLRGGLLGERLQVDRLIWRDPGGMVVTVQSLDLQGLRWHWFPRRGVWVALELDRADAELIAVTSGPPSGRALAPPEALQFPLQLTLGELAVGTLQFDTLSPVTALSVRGLRLDSADAGVHTLEQLSLRWQDFVLQAQARIGATGAMALTLDATVSPMSPDAPEAPGAAVAPGPQTPVGPPWTGTLQARGELQALDLVAQLRGQPGARGEPAPTLDVQARMAPFAAWPVNALDASFSHIDLRALQAGAPQTRLNGRAELRADTRDGPISLALQLDNTLPGRWDEARLPLRQWLLQASGSLQTPERVDVSTFSLDLGDANGARGAAGRVSGSAVWQGRQLELKTRLDTVQPHRLDSRAPIMRLTGPVALTLGGLPSPDPQAPKPDPAPELTAAIKLDLLGQVDGAPVPVQLALAAEGGPQRLNISRLRAQAGAASAELQLALERVSRRDWTLRSSGTLRQFDPVPWWPGAPGSTWRKGPHRLSGDWSMDVRLPDAARRLEPLALLPRLQGNGQLNITDSQLAGVPIAGELVLGYTPAARGRAGVLHGEFEIGGNRLTIDGQGDPTGPGTQDMLQLAVDAPRLAALAPLAALHEALTDWVPRSGSAQASLSAAGRWPTLRTEGTLALRALQAGELALDAAQAAWRLDSGGEQPLTLEATLDNLRIAGQTVARGRAMLRGNAAQHRIELEAAGPYMPPPLAGQMLALSPRSGTQVVLRADGSWQRAADGSGRWSAHVERLGLQPWDGQTLGMRDGDARWAELSDLNLALVLGADNSFQRLEADPGQVQLADIARLRWERVLVDLRPARPQLELRAELDPVRVAPLLARLQPGRGWSGDLRVGARVLVRAAETFEADIALQRRDGDLHIDGQAGTILLGLDEMLLTLTARDGVWEAVQTFKGRTLGEINGRQRLRTTAESRWPARDTPIQGGLEVQVADLGIWNNWVPPGWRLSGQILARARLSGPVGGPQYTGSVTAQNLAVRNLLEGVNVTEGEVDIALEGDRARIQTFTLRGGDGRLTLSGGATLGRRPVADLALQAERFRVLGRVDRQVVASGDARLQMAESGIRLDGKLRVDQGLFDTSRGDAPRLDSDVQVRRAGDPPPATAEAEAAARRRMQVAVDLDLGNNLVVRGRGLDTALRGQLRLTLPGGRLAINGTVNTERGTFVSYGQKLEIERGLIAFAGPPDNPRLDVLALRANTDVRVGVAITGNLQTMRVRLYSDPEMTDNAKLAWLVLGREPDGLGRTDTALLQRAAVALLAGEGEGTTDAVLRGLGIDDLSVRQTEGDSRDTVISLGKQLSRRWYLGYERGVNAAAGTWQLIYRVAQRITVRAQSGLENSLDVIWSWRVGELPAGEAGRTEDMVVVPVPPANAASVPGR
jgi:translocation and assembly module TamB